HGHDHGDTHQSSAAEHMTHQALSTQSAQTPPAKPVWQASDFDTALQMAREQGLTAPKLQIRPARDSQSTWIVEEMNHRWPLQVDSVSLDLSRRTVVDQLQFAQYPLVAKLIRWGIDAHIGMLFGWVNQLVLALVSALLCLSIVLAYRAWRLAHQLRQSTLQLARDMRLLWQRATLAQKISLTVLLIVLSIALPVFGLSIVIALLYTGLTT
ncbi:MAG: PepSY domain-containing protein, partial [Moraxellaceae bacterium]